MPTLETLDLSLKLTNIVVTNERSFGQFCYYLYQYGRESISKEAQSELAKLLKQRYPDKCKNDEECRKFLKENLLENDPFYYQIDSLRHYEIHLIQQMQEKDKNFINDVKQSYISRINKIPTNNFEFFILQMKLLRDFNGFLKKIYDIITTKL